MQFHEKIVGSDGIFLVLEYIDGLSLKEILDVQFHTISDRIYDIFSFPASR